MVTGLNLICALTVLVGIFINALLVYWMRNLLEQNREIERLMDEIFQAYKRIVEAEHAVRTADLEYREAEIRRRTLN